MEQRSARPTFEINGLTSGYQGEAAKPSCPRGRTQKFTCRLVPNQIQRGFAKSFAITSKKICPPTCRLESKPATARKRIGFADNAHAQAALRSLQKAI